MRLALPLLLLALSTACEWANEPVDDTDTDTTPAANCPTGQIAPSATTFNLYNFAWGGLPTFASFVDDPEVAGGTPACIDLNDISGTWRFVANNRPYGTLTLSAPGPGTYGDPSAGLAVTISVTGGDIDGTVGPGQWTSGSAVVTDDGTTFTITGSAWSGSTMVGDTSMIAYFSFDASATR